MDNMRYFHNFGLAERVNNEWVTSEGYTGERYTLPLRVTIPQQEQPNQTTRDDVQSRTVKYPLYAVNHKNKPDLQAVIDLYEQGKSFSYIGSKFKQHPTTIRTMLDHAGLVTPTGRRKKKAVK